MHISTTRRPVAVIADRGGPARTTTRPSARAIMTILTHEPPFPARKAQCIASQSVRGMVPPFSVARIRSAR